MTMQLELTTQAPPTFSPRLLISFRSRANIIRSVRDLNSQANKPSVCLTFDDGPDPLHTPMILDILREHKVSASFFVTGEAALHMPHIVARIVDAGHSLGNHSYSHVHPWLCSAAHARHQVSRTSEVITQIMGRPPRWFRPPFGRLRQAMLEQAAAEYMTPVLWSHSIIDWGWCATDAGIKRRLEKIKAGDIVLMHDGKRQSNRPEILARHLPKLLDTLKQHLVPVTLDQAAQ